MPILKKLKKLILASAVLLSATAFAGIANYNPTTNIFENPERGFQDGISNGESFNPSVSTHPLATVAIRLDRFKNNPNLAADPCFLSGLANSFAAARTAGVKVIVYFLYNYGPANNPGDYRDCHNNIIHNDGADASINTILSHISQLGPTLNTYNDVIYEIHAGFIGQFGEWHDSTNQNDTIIRHNQVITAELNNFPSNRRIVLRRPAYKLNYIGCNCPGSHPQLGHYNERFVDDSDSELFNDPQGVWSSTDCRSFYDYDVAFTANGADAASGPGLISGITAVNRMQQYHYSTMGAYPGLISYWQTSFPSQYATMQQQLGYRFQVTQATTPDTVTRGQANTVTVKLKDNGFSKLMNVRNMYALFINPGNSVYVDTTTFKDPNNSDDLRNLTLAAGTVTYTTSFVIPTTFVPGTTQVYVWLPDYSNQGQIGTGLQANPLFSSRVDGVTWSASLGANLLPLNNIQVN